MNLANGVATAGSQCAMPGALRVLDADREQDYAEWVCQWLAWPEREPMAHPAYVRLFRRECDRVVCLCAGDAGSGILYPLLLRPLSVEPWATGAGELWDATTPYGYGGAFAWSDASRVASPRFWSAVTTWLRDARVVSSVARLSLFEDQVLPFDGEVTVNMPNVVRSLDVPIDLIWRDYAHKVRKNVNAARRAGLQVEFDTEGRRLDEFLDIYASTMERRNAAEGYYFSREFFQRLVAALRGAYVFVHVLSGEKIVSTELVLRSAHHLYSFLGGTRAEAFELRPNDLLKHAVIEWGTREGYTHYVLGGGYGGPDGIFKYKLAFAPGGEVPFRLGRAIHDRDAYEALVTARHRFEDGRGTWSPRQGFFPEYRG